MTRKKRDLGNDTYFTVYNSDLKLIKDPVKKILYSKLKNWIYRNEDKPGEFHLKAGYWWTFGTYEYWAGECGLEPNTVGKHLRELVRSGILKTGNYNRLKIDNTIWYRLATEDELKNINFRLLFYGKSKEKNSSNHSNETLYRMYQNGMIEVTNNDVHSKDLGSTILEDITEDISENSLEYISEHKSGYSTVKIEDYNNLINIDDILIHIEYLTKNNFENIPTDKIKLFLDKFHDWNIDKLKEDNGLYYYCCRIDGMYEKKLNSFQLNFIKDLAGRYYNNIISPQPAEQKGDEVSSTIASSPRIPLDPSSPETN
jgi:DNA-binding transcriptional ArsR family regulator